MQTVIAELSWIRAVGVRNWLIILYDRLARRLGRRSAPVGDTDALLQLATNDDGHPLFFRSGTSDPLVFRQIFIEQEYSPILTLDGVETIVDAGANVGYASAWFLSRFPEAKVLAIEPDSENFAVLESNLAPYESRVTLLNGALWSKECVLVPSETTFRDGREWSYQFVPRHDDARQGLQAIGVLSAMRLLGAPRLSVLKIDIEGAEAEVFGAERGQWLHLVDTLVVELHADSSFGDAHHAFSMMMADQPFEILKHGELTICRRTGGF